MGGIYRSQCWKCKYATRPDKCKWVETLERQNYYDLTEDGFIHNCKKFCPDHPFVKVNEFSEKDQTKVIYKNKDAAKILGISERTFYRNYHNCLKRLELQGYLYQGKTHER